MAKSSASAQRRGRHRPRDASHGHREWPPSLPLPLHFAAAGPAPAPTPPLHSFDIPTVDPVHMHMAAPWMLAHAHSHAHPHSAAKPTGPVPGSATVTGLHMHPPVHSAHTHAQAHAQHSRLPLQPLPPPPPRPHQHPGAASPLVAAPFESAAAAAAGPATGSCGLSAALSYAGAAAAPHMGSAHRSWVAPSGPFGSADIRMGPPDRLRPPHLVGLPLHLDLQGWVRNIEMSEWYMRRTPSEKDDWIGWKYQCYVAETVELQVMQRFAREVYRAGLRSEAIQGLPMQQSLEESEQEQAALSLLRAHAEMRATRSGALVQPPTCACGSVAARSSTRHSGRERGADADHDHSMSVASPVSSTRPCAAVAVAAQLPELALCPFPSVLSAGVPPAPDLVGIETNPGPGAGAPWHPHKRHRSSQSPGLDSKRTQSCSLMDVISTSVITAVTVAVVGAVEASRVVPRCMIRFLQPHWHLFKRTPIVRGAVRQQIHASQLSVTSIRTRLRMHGQRLDNHSCQRSL